MNSLALLLQNWIQQIVHSLFLLEHVSIEVTCATQAEFGDYQCNSAMRLASILKQSPRQIAQEITNHLITHHSQDLSKVEVAGSGFINITFSNLFLVQKAQQFDLRGQAPIWLYKKVLVDFSSPNTAKEMHVGHLRSTIIGDCLANILEFVGCEVLRINHIGDWGTQFGMLITWLEKELGKEKIIEIVNQKSCDWDLPFLMKAYQKSKECFDLDYEFSVLAKQKVLQLQSHEPVSYGLWLIICEISRKGYQQIYDLLGVKIVECGESFYSPLLIPMIEQLQKKEMITLSNGAKCIFCEGYDVPLMVQKSDGGFSYDSTDLAAITYRAQELEVDQIIYITDSGQKLHFQLLFEAAKLTKLIPEKLKLNHVPFGLVLGPDGKKFKTRSGQTEKLFDLLNAAIEAAADILEKRGMPDNHVLAKALGLNAVKYADLSCYRVNDYSFSYEKMLRFEGNTAAFLMYAYVRTRSLLEKFSGASFENAELAHASERQLLLKILQFNEALHSTLVDLAPNRLAEYLWQLSQSFNAFFRDCRIEGSSNQAERMALVNICSDVLGCGLQLLGLQLVDKM
jgi:arginyl-tRNA synthetase